jgi:hypothetical protein
MRDRVERGSKYPVAVEDRIDEANADAHQSSPRTIVKNSTREAAARAAAA